MNVSAAIPGTPARLRNQRDYVRLLGARVTGGAANQMLMVALGWQMYDLTASAWDLGLVGLAQFLPALLLTAASLAFASTGGRVAANLILMLSVLLGCARRYATVNHACSQHGFVLAQPVSRGVAALFPYETSIRACVTFNTV